MKESQQIRHQNLPEEDKDYPKVFFLLMLSVVVMVVHEWVPEGPEEDFFPLAEQLISPPSHVYYAEEHLSRMCLIAAIFTLADKYKWIFDVFLFYELIMVIDYMLHYNKNWFYVAGQSVDANTFKLLLYGTLITITLIKIRYGQKTSNQ